MGRVLPKLDVNAAPGPTGLRNGHLRIWAGVFAPPSAEEVVEWLEKLLTYMANGRLPAWFLQAVHAAELMALVKTEAKREGEIADHMPV